MHLKKSAMAAIAGVSAFGYCFCAWGQSAAVPQDFFMNEGSRLSFAQGGSALDTGISAIRINPSMLALEPQYSVSAGYHWSSFGQNFYNAGVVDSKTSRIAAGISTRRWHEGAGLDFHSPMPSEIHAAGAMLMGRMSLGATLSQHRFRAAPEDSIQEVNDNTITSSYSASIGAAMPLSRELLLAVSSENILGSDNESIAPRSLRLGAGYRSTSGLLQFGLDYYFREGLVGVERKLEDRWMTQFGLVSPTDALVPEDVSHHSMIATAMTRVYNMVILRASAGRNFSTENSVWGGAIMLNNHNFSIGYHLFNEDNRPQTQAFQIDMALNI